MVASESMGQTLRLWDTATGRETHALQGHHGSIFAVAFSPNSAVVASGSGDNTIILWDVATSEQRLKFERHTGEISAVTFSPDGMTVASGSDDKTVRLWDAATGEELQIHRTLKPVSKIAFSDDGLSLKTDTGQFDLGTIPSTHANPVTNPLSTIDLRSPWIKHQGTNLFGYRMSIALLATIRLAQFW